MRVHVTLCICVAVDSFGESTVVVPGGDPRRADLHPELSAFGGETTGTPKERRKAKKNKE